MPTRNEARKALNKAKLPARDKYVYRSLADRADNSTLEIPDRYQPYRQSDQYVFGTSRRNAQRALDHLHKHGWVSWFPKQKLRQCGRPPNHYMLHIGTDCDCPRDPKPEGTAKGSGGSNPGANGKHLASLNDPSTDQIKRQNSPSIKRQDDAQLGRIKRQDDAPKSARQHDVSAGQGQVLPKGVRDREGLGEGLALTDCSQCGTPMDPILPALGYSTHPCCDPDEITALKESA